MILAWTDHSKKNQSFKSLEEVEKLHHTSKAMYTQIDSKNQVSLPSLSLSGVKEVVSVHGATNRIVPTYIH